MKVENLKKISERYTHGSIDDKTWFRKEKVEDDIITWWCTHGSWRFYTDLNGKYIKVLSPVKANITDVYVKDQYMGLFGKENKEK